MLLIIKSNSMLSSACFISIVFFLCSSALLRFASSLVPQKCFTCLYIYPSDIISDNSDNIPSVLFLLLWHEIRMNQIFKLSGFLLSLNIHGHLINLCSQILKDVVIYFSHIRVNIFMISFLEYKYSWFHKTPQHIFVLNWNKVYEVCSL